ncbi:hypothetical protein J3Q64DRAFT_1633722, partial [Phycomyces blakesleeanus]
KRKSKGLDKVRLCLADRILRLYGIKQLKVLLIKHFSSFANSDRTKALYDRHKGLFGALAMLKTAVNDFFLASISTFFNLKLFFLYMLQVEKTIYLWSMRFFEEGQA